MEKTQNYNNNLHSMFCFVLNLPFTMQSIGGKIAFQDL